MGATDRFVTTILLKKRNYDSGHLSKLISSIYIDIKSSILHIRIKIFTYSYL